MRANTYLLVSLCFTCIHSLLLQTPSIAFGQDEVQQVESLPGLVGEYRFQGQQLKRIDADVNFVGSEKPGEQAFLADDRLPTGEFQVVWRGEIQVREAGPYDLSMFGAGQFKLTIEGQVVIDQQANSPQWLHAAEPLLLPSGKQKLKIEYASLEKEPAVGLFWSGPGFGLEPLGAENLSHPAAESVLQHHERGRNLSRALRCSACHAFQRSGELPTTAQVLAATAMPQLAAPSLKRVADNLRPSWLMKRLTSKPADTSADFPNARMPHFALHRNDAAAITAALFAASELSTAPESLATIVRELKQEDKSSKEPIREVADADRGKLLFVSKGCVACHQPSQRESTTSASPSRLQTDKLFSGGDLANIAAKRTKEFFLRWLADAASVNPMHRMPVFELPPLDRYDLAFYLATLGADASANDTRPFGDAARGIGLIQQHRCDACHDLPQSLSGKALGLAKSFVSADSNWSAGCLTAPQATSFQPGFDLADADRQALRAYLTAAMVMGAQNGAHHLLLENNCLSCHARGKQAGIAQWIGQLASDMPELAPRLAAVVPPSLNSIGDKLHDQALSNAIARTEAPRRPWLDVQMPKFNLAAGQLESLVAGLVSHDRIPDEARGDVDELESLTDSQVALLAGRLVTAEGFGCQSCHQIGTSLPANVALNARGSDLTMPGERMRASWFQRWVRNPARIVPRMEMPAIQVAAPGILHDSLDAQLSALWRTLNTQGFEPPKANAVRMVRQRNDPTSRLSALVLTDVIETPQQTFLRPLVIGLSNRHNLLFDLEKGELAKWWVGDTGHQHTRGKAWYWTTGSPPLVDYEFLERLSVMDEQGDLFRPQIVGQVAVELDSITHADAGVTWSGTLHLASEQSNRTLSMSQHFVPSEESGGAVRTVLAGLQATDRVLIESSGQLDEATENSTTARVARLDSINSVEIVSPNLVVGLEDSQQLVLQTTTGSDAIEWTSTFRSKLPADRLLFAEFAYPPTAAQELDCVPGYQALKLPLPANEMPIALTWNDRHELFVGSLKGRVLKAIDSDGDGELDQYQRISDEFPTPYGLNANGDGTLDVLTKFGLLRLSPSSHTPVWNTQVIADGWGYTSDYHDWAVGLRQDQDGNYWMTLPCQQDQRSEAAAHFRGQALKLIPNPDSEARRLYRIESFAAGLRFPMGLALNDADELFTSDNQGNYNPFNELNHVRQGKRYGFINQLENKPGFNPPYESPAINLPHPWTRSVNGICFLTTPKSVASAEHPAGHMFGPFEGHLLGCEMNGRSLIRMSLQQVGDTYQGAAYPFSRTLGEDEATFEGPIVCEISPQGEIYIGNLKDSGWGGGQNTGSIVRLTANQSLPLGIAEVRARSSGFEIDFTGPVDPLKAVEPLNYSLRSYARVATPAYGGDDQDEQFEVIQSITLSEDRRQVVVELTALRAGAVYELNVAPVGDSTVALFPNQAHYTMRQIP